MAGRENPVRTHVADENRVKSYSWPHEAGPVAFVSVNFDAESFDLGEVVTEKMFGRFSYGRYGISVGYPRLIQLLERHGIAAKFFVPSADARRHLDLVRDLVQLGYEIGARGLTLEKFASLGE